MNKSTYFIIFITTYAYAFIRYIVFGQTPLADIPLFITNKAISFSIIIILFLNAVRTFKKTTTSNEQNNVYLVLSFLIISHILISVSLLTPEYYAKFFNENKFNISGSLSILFGVIATAIIFSKMKLKNYLVLSMLALHLFFMGYKGWVTVENWSGNMPPITLLSFILVMLIIVFEKKSEKTFP